jgi:succinate dehydrogenase hydrophobic anchor subunit
METQGNSMTKENLAWLLIRFIGVILIIFSLYFIYQLAIYLLVYLSIEPSVTVGTDGIKTIRLQNINWTPLTNGVFCLASSIYFLKRGSFVHKLLLSNV